MAHCVGLVAALSEKDPFVRDMSQLSAAAAAAVAEKNKNGEEEDDDEDYDEGDGGEYEESDR
jgi:hypothetical protein